MLINRPVGAPFTENNISSPTKITKAKEIKPGRNENIRNLRFHLIFRIIGIGECEQPSE